MSSVSAAAIIVAFALDLAIGEWPRRTHPVSWYGSLLGWLDREWGRPGLVGSLTALGLPLAAAGVAAGLTWSAAKLHPLGGAAVAGSLLFTSTSLRRLLTVARTVVRQSSTDLTAARETLPALVGRDPASLSAAEVRSAAVESAAENLSDGFVAPLSAFVLLSWSLPLAAAGATFVKAVNTGDSMLGYPAKPVGWGYARVDDAVMWLPARLTAGLIAVAVLDPAPVRQAREYARAPVSPNAGWPMATLGRVIDCELSKPGQYTLWPGAGLPSTAEARRGIRIVGRAGFLAVAAAVVIAWY